MLSPAGLAPCAGNAGIGPCDGLPGPAAIGDVDGAFDSGPGDVDLADLVIGAPTYDETTASNPACDPGQCHQAGRSYVYRGEDIMDPANGGAATPLQVPLRALKSVTAQTDMPTSSARTDSELFGQAMFPIGDVGSCNAATPAGEVCPNASSTATPDGSPEVVISAFRTDLPSNANFADPAFFDVGVNMLVDGKTGSVLAIYQHPEPQSGSIFGFTLHNEPAAGDLGSTPLADVFIPAMRQTWTSPPRAAATSCTATSRPAPTARTSRRSTTRPRSPAATSASRRPASATSFPMPSPGHPGGAGSICGRRSDRRSRDRVVGESHHRRARLRRPAEWRRGGLREPGGVRGGQDIELQARATGATRYSTVTRMRTNGEGSFSATVRPSRTTSYRARLAQTPACLGAVSDTQTVAVPPRVSLVSRTARLSAAA